MIGKLTFLGAVQNVTGSCTMVESSGKRLLVDCGLYQERKLKNRNWEPFPVSPADIDGVLLTHAHLDHCGLLPKLVKDGFRGKIYGSPATLDIVEIILLDSARIQQEDAIYKAKRHQKENRVGPFPEQPLYTVEDVQATLPLFSSVPYKEPVPVGGGLEACFFGAGHILGSTMIQLRLTDGGEVRTVLFSGDVGRDNTPIIRDPSHFEQADYVQVESTYGDRIHEPEEDIPAGLAKVINETHQAGGNVVIPSFAVERTQELLYHLGRLLKSKSIPKMKVFLDSPMAIRVTEVFRKYPELFEKEMQEMIRRGEQPCEFPGLTLTRSVEESKAINTAQEPIIIIAGSGMCTGGRIKHHLVANLGRPESTILFVGYQAAGTLGRIILDGVKEVRVLGETRPVEARIARIHGFSAHADQKELCDWLGFLKQPPRRVFCVHGEPESSATLARVIHERFGWPTLVPEFRSEAILE